mmetsp:Transcript_26802/g.68179  ORF Transcript_26802/g.68179 Transcript_26802/m.68179 type:complete len:322 (+) Transcript_26802:61-1026(+)|eukprot:CAMPEP_0115855926 /NCGR_PEP_ID=MMETSP0287-20121206/14791_1 /TAXON_ID=412157 /ORGANISM="Chrysochromulina rotalis, Strain UIO044" /LENGTH=321 /DNA_ID=CAMNT_0003310089 /DNA_START=61 /DNA_END=1026 /DNA_ORIENTATION=+
MPCASVLPLPPPLPLNLPLAATLIDLTLPPISVVDLTPARHVEGARSIASDDCFWKKHQELSRLGRGCFGSVLHVRDRASARTAAVKVVSSAPHDHDDECPLREPELLHLAQHQHVVKLFDVFQSPTTLFLLQEVASKDLMAYAIACPEGVLAEPETQGYVAGLLSAVQHLHGLRIVHRDIKATNVLLSDCGEVRLADFGLAVRLPDDGLLTSVCGTHDYLAPEMIRCGHGEEEGYGTPVDIWGVGLLMYGLLCGGNPFERNTDIATLQAILAGDLQLLSERALSAPACDLIQRLLDVDPARRLCAKAALHEPWLVEFTTS